MAPVLEIKEFKPFFTEKASENSIAHLVTYPELFFMCKCCLKTLTSLK